MVCTTSCVSRYEDVRVGECAELLLLSNTPDFSSFKVGLLGFTDDVVHALLSQASAASANLVSPVPMPILYVSLSQCAV